MLRRMRDVGVKVVCTAGLSSAFACWWYRPVVDRRNGEGTRRSGSMSAIDYHDSYCRPYPFSMQLGSMISTALVVCGCRFFLYGLGRFEIKDDEHYRNFVKKSYNRSPRTPMYTLPNHRSLMDDPMVLASLLPFWMNIQPHFLRWAVCAQEICFREENIITAFFGVGGKTLPICRGESLDQPQLLQLARKGVGTFNSADNNGQCQTTGSEIRSAGWVNIHSEAGVFQNEHAIGGRRNGKEKDIGRLKWGAAKLIVHNPSYDTSDSLVEDSESYDLSSKNGPIVIPFYVSGMDTVTPLNEHKRLIQPIPVPGHSVKVRFGPELRFDDLIAEYEKKVGSKIRKYHCCSNPHCQERRVVDFNFDIRAINVLLSTSLWDYFEKTSDVLSKLFWRTLAWTGVVEVTDDHLLSKRPFRFQSNMTMKGSEKQPPHGLMYDLETWKSTPEEKELYCRVMLRIEDAMQRLCDENRLEEMSSETVKAE